MINASELISELKAKNFDVRGGVLLIPRRMLESGEYIRLSMFSKVLIIELQKQWRQYRPVSLGIREACKAIGCANKTAIKAFNELMDAGFIEMEHAHVFNANTEKRRPRAWVLTWMPFKDEPPSNRWNRNYEDAGRSR